MAAVLTCGMFPPTLEAASPEDLDPLLRSLSIRPWWGDPPALTLPGLDGQRHALSELRGRAVLLYFWATW